MVLLEVPAEGGGLDKGAHRQDTWEADRSENTPWRAQLDLHSHYRQHCLEHAAQEPLPAPLQTGVLDSSPSMLSMLCSVLVPLPQAALLCACSPAVC